MKKLLLAAAAAFTLAAPVAAHEVWMERDGAGPVRVYLGEPAQPMPAGGDPEFAKLQAPKVFAGSTKATLPLARKVDHIEASAPAAGDVRLFDDAVFAPWDNGTGGFDGVVYYARVGRSEPQAALDLELVPVAANADRFTILYKGAPLPGATVTMINPDKWSKAFTADAQGIVTVPTEWQGRYLLSVTHKAKEPAALGGKPVANVHHIATLTFVK